MYNQYFDNDFDSVMSVLWPYIKRLPDPSHHLHIGNLCL